MDACYHIWKSAATGNALFRVQRCYDSKQKVDAAIRRWRKHQPARVKKGADGNPLTDKHGNPIMVRPPAAAVMMTLKCHSVDDDTMQAICPCPCAKKAAEDAREQAAIIAELAARGEPNGGAIDDGELAA